MCRERRKDLGGAVLRSIGVPFSPLVLDGLKVNTFFIDLCTFLIHTMTKMFRRASQWTWYSRLQVSAISPWCTLNPWIGSGVCRWTALWSGMESLVNLPGMS